MTYTMNRVKRYESPDPWPKTTYTAVCDDCGATAGESSTSETYAKRDADLHECGIECASCGASVDPLAVFPGRICLSCYSKTPEANAPLTGEQVAGMFRRAVRR